MKADSRETTLKPFSSRYELLSLILDSLEAIIYVADMKTHQILYVNRYTRGLFGNDLVGRRCWEAFQNGRTGPCDFCTNARLLDEHGNPRGVVPWEFINPKLNTWFAIRDCAIPWEDGRMVRLELAVDVSRLKEAEEALVLSRDEFERLVRERTQQLRVVNRDLEQSRRELLAHQDRIEGLNRELVELNGALRVLARNLDKAKSEAELKTLRKVRSRIMPLLTRIRDEADPEVRGFLLDSLAVYLDNSAAAVAGEAGLNDILTLAEVRVATFIRDGKGTSEIADLLCISENTVKTHRRNIRRKINLPRGRSLKHHLRFKYPGNDGAAE